MPSDPFMRALETYFQAHARSIGQISAAASCREGWLQGSLYLWIRQQRGFRELGVNHRTQAKNAIDLWMDGRRPLAAEVKFIGDGYEPKCITGGVLSDVVNLLETRPVGPEDEALRRGPWGLIPDYFRLLHL